MISMITYMFVSLYACMQQLNLSLNLLSLVTVGLWFDFLYMYKYVVPNCMKLCIYSFFWSLSLCWSSFFSLCIIECFHSQCNMKNIVSFSMVPIHLFIVIMNELNPFGLFCLCFIRNWTRLLCRVYFLNH